MKEYIEYINTKYNDLIKQEESLRNNIITLLKKAISNSTQKSIHKNTNCISIELLGYEEMVCVDDVLLFHDNYGYESSIDNGDCETRDLIDIVNNLK